MRHCLPANGVQKQRKDFLYYIADPGKGKVVCTEKEFKENWLSTQSKGEEKGVAMFLNPTPAFKKCNMTGEQHGEKRSFSFLLSYIYQYKKYFGQIVLGLLVGCILQLILPFLTQAIVDIGITHQNLKIIWLILLGQLVLTVSRTTVDFIRRWILLHISMRINISLVSDFFIKLLKLPMSFFDTKLMGDLLQRMEDHKRIEQFLTTQTLSVMFSLLSFVIFGIVLFCYNILIFGVFLLGSILYGVWIATFLRRRKVLDYEVFEKQSINNNKTYQFITSMQEIKLQDCEQRRHWEWEDVQADLFDVQMKSLKLQQTQEAGSIFINEVKNILITVVAATAVIHGSMTLGYYPVLNGELKIGDTNINDINLKWWRRQCGVVMQDGIIFSESIARNIAVDDEEIDGNRVLRAVEIANIKGMQMEMEGYIANTFGYRDGIITETEDSVITMNGRHYFRAILEIRSPYRYNIKKDMDGFAFILISDKSILQYILDK